MRFPYLPYNLMINVYMYIANTCQMYKLKLLKETACCGGNRTHDSLISRIGSYRFNSHRSTCFFSQFQFVH